MSVTWSNKKNEDLSKSLFVPTFQIWYEQVIHVSNLLSKSIDRFLYDRGLLHERIKWEPGRDNKRDGRINEIRRPQSSFHKFFVTFTSRDVFHVVPARQDLVFSTRDAGITGSIFPIELLKLGMKNFNISLIMMKYVLVCLAFFP